MGADLWAETLRIARATPETGQIDFFYLPIVRRCRQSRGDLCCRCCGKLDSAESQEATAIHENVNLSGTHLTKGLGAPCPRDGIRSLKPVCNYSKCYALSASACQKL